MTRLAFFILFIVGFSIAGEWESFPIRENGTIPVWLVAGPLPNGSPQFHDDGCFGYFKDYLENFGGESYAIPKESETIEFADGKKIAWETAFSKPSGLLDFIDIFL